MTWFVAAVALLALIVFATTEQQTWQSYAAWLAVGAGLMVLAILLNNGWMS